jgi:hypothetical protein
MPKVSKNLTKNYHSFKDTRHEHKKEIMFLWVYFFTNSLSFQGELALSASKIKKWFMFLYKNFVLPSKVP